MISKRFRHARRRRAGGGLEVSPRLDAAAAPALLAGLLAVSAALVPTQAPAQDADARLTIELNALGASQKGCLLTFVASNGLATGFRKAAYEIALFNKAGLVERLTVFDFRDLPAGKTRVRQFDLPQVDCADVGRLLVNSVSACEADAEGPAECSAHLKTVSKTEVNFDS